MKMAKEIFILAVRLALIAVLGAAAWQLITTAHAMEVTFSQVVWACVLVPIALSAGLIGALAVFFVPIFLFCGILGRSGKKFGESKSTDV